MTYFKLITKLICLMLTLLQLCDSYTYKRNENFAEKLEEKLHEIEDELQKGIEALEANDNNGGNTNGGDNKEKHPSLFEWDRTHTDREAFEGDIILNPQQKKKMTQGGGPQGDFIGDNTAHWDDYYTDASTGRRLIKIPFKYAAGVSKRIKTAVKEAIAEYDAKTCIRFVKRTNEPHYISIIDSDGCWSYVGRQGGEQELSLQDYGCSHKFIAVHEMKHALGYYHEQSRPDRDQYVKINLQNVISGMEHNFNKMETSSTHGTPYDYVSVMHYGAYDFSANGQPTIVRKGGTAEEKEQFGNFEGLSEIDAQSLKIIYCKDDEGTAVTTEPPITVTDGPGPEVTPTGPEVTPTDPGVTPTDPEVTPIGPTVTPIGPTVTPIGPTVTPIGPETNTTQPTVISECDEMLGDPLFCNLVRRERRFCRYCAVNNACPWECVDRAPAEDCEWWMWYGDCTADLEYMSNFCSQTCRSEYCGEDVDGTAANAKKKAKSTARPAKMGIEGETPSWYKKKRDMKNHPRPPKSTSRPVKREYHPRPPKKLGIEGEVPSWY